MIFDDWQVVPLIGVGLTTLLWAWLFLTRTKRVNNENNFEKEHYLG